MNDRTATGRPKQSIPLLPRVGAAALCSLAVLEVLRVAQADETLRRAPLGRTLGNAVDAFLPKY
jgi:hypothetical protein